MASRSNIEPVSMDSASYSATRPSANVTVRSLAFIDTAGDSANSTLAARASGSSAIVH